MTSTRVFTRKTGVAGLQVGHEFSRTRVDAVQGGVRDGHVTRPTTGALAVQLRQDVGRTADAAVVLSHAPAELHAPVPR